MTVVDNRHQPATDDSWHLRGACRAHPVLDADAWFPPPGNPSAAHEAIQVCRTCPVVQQCAAASFRNREPVGIWGGIREGERNKILRRRDGQPRECGHHLAYQDHRRNGEDVDDACQEAWNEYQRAYRARRKAGEAATAP